MSLLDALLVFRSTLLVLCRLVAGRTVWGKPLSPDPTVIPLLSDLVRWPRYLVAFKRTHSRTKTMWLFSLWTDTICRASSVIVALPTSWSVGQPTCSHCFILGSDSTLPFPSGSLPHLLPIYLSAGGDGLKHHHLFFFFFSVRELPPWTCRGKDTRAQTPGDSLGPELGHIPEWGALEWGTQVSV